MDYFQMMNLIKSKGGVNNKILSNKPSLLPSNDILDKHIQPPPPQIEIPIPSTTPEIGVINHERGVKLPDIEILPKGGIKLPENNVIINKMDKKGVIPISKENEVLVSKIMSYAPKINDNYDEETMIGYDNMFEDHGQDIDQTLQKIDGMIDSSEKMLKIKYIEPGEDEAPSIAEAKRKSYEQGIIQGKKLLQIAKDQKAHALYVKINDLENKISNADKRTNVNDLKKEVMQFKQLYKDNVGKPYDSMKQKHAKIEKQYNKSKEKKIKIEEDQKSKEKKFKIKEERKTSMVVDNKQDVDYKLLLDKLVGNKVEEYFATHKPESYVIDYNSLPNLEEVGQYDDEYEQAGGAEHTADDYDAHAADEDEHEHEHAGGGEQVNEVSHEDKIDQFIEFIKENNNVSEWDTEVDKLTQDDISAVARKINDLYDKTKIATVADNAKYNILARVANAKSLNATELSLWKASHPNTPPPTGHDATKYRLKLDIIKFHNNSEYHI